MKKILTKGKGFLSLFVLVLISVFVISSVTSASLSATGKRQYKASKGYRSQTKVTGAYDDRGFAYNISALARIGSKDKIVYGAGSVTSYSPYILNKMNAHHGYAIGNTVMKVWMEN